MLSIIREAKLRKRELLIIRQFSFVASKFEAFSLKIEYTPF